MPGILKRCLPFFLIFFLIFYFLFFIFNFSIVSAEDLSVTIRVGSTTLTFSGKTSPSAQVTFMESGAVVGTTQADTNGDFSKSLIYFVEGEYTIGIYATDSENRTTSTVSYSRTLILGQDTTVSNVILPPTITLSSSSVTAGDSLTVSGQSALSSTIDLTFSNSNTGSTSPNSAGSWQYSYDTSGLSAGNYSVYAKTTVGSYQSEASETKSFTVSAVPTPTPTPTPTATLTPTPTTGGPTNTPAPGPTNTPGPGPTNTPGPAATATPKPKKAIISYLPSLIAAFFDPDGDGKIETDELYSVVKIWVEEWRGFVKEVYAVGLEGEIKPPEKCDLNYDKVCSLADLSILLFYVGR